MKQLFLLLLAVPLLFSACKKEDKCPYTESSASATAQERLDLQAYLTVNSISAIEDPSGVYYNITPQGTGANPSICSNVTVKYTGSLIPTGSIFDSTPAGSSTSFTLGQLIVGWQKVLPQLKMGGKITMYIPPSLGYGSNPVRNSNGVIVIPANSYLQFDVELINVQ